MQVDIGLGWMPLRLLGPNSETFNTTSEHSFQESSAPF